MDNNIFCAEYIFFQILKSLIQRIKILSGYKYTAQSKYRKSGVVLCEVMVSALINKEVIF